MGISTPTANTITYLFFDASNIQPHKVHQFSSQAKVTEKEFIGSPWLQIPNLNLVKKRSIRCFKLKRGEARIRR